MKIKKEQIQSALKELNGEPIWEGANQYRLSTGQIIQTNEIDTLSQLIKVIFIAGMDNKIKEVKSVLEITDPRF